MVSTMLLLSFVVLVLGDRDFMEFRLNSNQLGLPIFNFCDKYQLMIDTGSDQLWLSDSSCRNCQKTMNLCPHLKESKHQIDYFLGDVKGDFTALNTCLGIIQIFCVKQAHFFDNLNSHGILGINGNSTGKHFIAKYFQTNQINHLTVSFVLLSKEQKLIFGKVPQKYKKGEFYIENAGWNININGMSYDNHMQTFDSLVGYFDSGSNMLVIPEIIYKLIHAYIRQVMHTFNCADESEEKIMFKCQQPIDLHQKLCFMMKGMGQQKQTQISIQLIHLLQVKGQIYYFQVQQTKQNKIIFGFNTFRGYIVCFDLSGKLKIYESRFEQLVRQQQFNFSLVIMQYIVVVAVVAVVVSKLQHLINQNINKKIVI